MASFTSTILSTNSYFWLIRLCVICHAEVAFFFDVILCVRYNYITVWPQAIHDFFHNHVCKISTAIFRHVFSHIFGRQDKFKQCLFAGQCTCFSFWWFGELPYWLQYWLSFFFIFTWFWADISRVWQMCTSNVMISNFAKFALAVSLKLARTSEVHNIEIQSSYTHCHLISRLLALYGANKEEKLQVYKNTKLASIPMKPILCICENPDR